VATPAVFLDRDGTLIEDVGYVDRLDRMRLYPWSVEAVRLLRRAGYAAVVVTNQAGVARGMINEQVVVEVRDHLQEHLARAGERLDGHYYCPHLPDAPVAAYRRRCRCHKPEPGMIRQAAAELTLDLSRSVVVGDRWTDIRLARAAGTAAILVETGYGASQAASPAPGETADAVASNLLEAAGWILGHLPHPCRG
jgi:D-glycero-D-manno-heptose 1,7-bisphosphate phosphatase